MRILVLVTALVLSLAVAPLFVLGFPDYPGPGEILVCVDNNRAVGQCHIEREET